MKNTRNFNRSYKVELVPDPIGFRPVYRNIIFKGGYLYATDGIILVKLPLELFASNFSPEERDKLNCHYLDVSAYKKLAGYDLQIEDGFIKAKCAMYEFDMKLGNLEELHYPDFDKVLTGLSELQERKAVGLDADRLLRLKKAMNITGPVSISFTDRNRGMKVSCSSGSLDGVTGIIMPCRTYHDN